MITIELMLNNRTECTYTLLLSCILNSLFSNAGASGSAVTIASSIIQSVILISTNLNQEGITQQLGRILDQLHSGKVALGVVGLVNSGKNTTINAFIGEKYLPASFQPQTLRTIRIVSDHVTLSTLQGKTSSDEFIELARGQKEICRRVKEFNDIDRDHLHTGHVYCQPLYTELLLTAPINFLKDSDNIKLEIFETPGFGEFGCSTALSTSKIALKEMAALVLVVDIQSLFEKMSHDIVEQIQVLHPLMMKRHHRMLVLLNKYDICFDGNEESWSLQELCKKVSNLFDCQLLPSQIIPFSAKWALESRQWLMHESLPNKRRRVWCCILQFEKNTNERYCKWIKAETQPGECFETWTVHGRSQQY